VHPAGPKEALLIARHDIYSAALAYVDGRIDIEGDIVEAIRELTSTPPSRLRRGLVALAAWLWDLQPERWYQSRDRARLNVQFHYDHDPEFFRQFLGRRLVYSCAYFERPGMTLDEAQLAKLDHICRKLDLRAGERFLDIGCGFGALVMRAADRYGVNATGCTLSVRQRDTAGAMLRKYGRPGHASVRFADYRSLDDTFDKIASVGMIEHVGVHRLPQYFTKVYSMLAPEGVFLSHGIARPETVKIGPEWRFLQQRVFPGGELPHLSEIIREAEKAGFEVLDVENLRPHYARTCRLWVERLMAHQDACCELVGRLVHRTWLLYLAASAVTFEEGLTEVHQVLLTKRSSPRVRHWSRRYIYG
jgi:cyclopropane-fatty-acyl-phospholipid synthase